jgi:hypothetical protein
MRLVRFAITSIVVAGISALTLAGCAPDRGGLEQPTPTTDPVVSSGAPTPSQAPEPVVGAPFTVDCSALLSDDEVFQYNQNFAADAQWVPAAGSLAAQVVAEGGTACAWANLSGGDEIEIAVATPSPNQLATLKKAASSGKATKGLGDEGYFSQDGEYGQLQVFRGPYWLTAVSLYFGQSGEANQLVYSALSHLP